VGRRVRAEPPGRGTARRRAAGNDNECGRARPIITILRLNTG